MLSSIVDAVSVALNGEFGDDYEIYSEEIEQGLKEPCFFISVIDSSIQPYPGGRYFRRSQLCIQYFPVSASRNRECEDAAVRMEQSLECIVYDDGMIRGTDMSHEVHDGVMSFFVNYNMFIERIDEDNTQMESMLSDTVIKEVE